MHILNEEKRLDLRQQEVLNERGWGKERKCYYGVIVLPYKKKTIII